jgi:hypothetical protein
MPIDSGEAINLEFLNPGQHAGRAVALSGSEYPPTEPRRKPIR